MNKYWIILSILLTICSHTRGQQIVEGIILNSDNLPIVGANVIVRKSKLSEVILTYAISNTFGKFKLKIDETTDSIFIKITHIDYLSSELFIKNIRNDLKVILNTSVKKLDEIIINPVPIFVKKDTLNYLTQNFISKEDRVIGDVLKKLPGVEVLNSGQILYQGKPIQKFYVDGLDLMEGRYNIINNNLPAGIVNKVQVIENDQPIKVLDSIVFSDKASLNLQLKKVSLSGSAKVGIGLSPILWDINITPMLFTKKVQLLNSYQSNNIGNNISRDIDNLISDETNDTKSHQFSSYLSVDQVMPPLINSKYWLKNNSHLISLNGLKKIAKNTQLKANISFLNENQNLFGINQSSYFTTLQTINIREKQLIFKNLNNSNGNLIIEKNTKKIFLKNMTQFKFQNNRALSNLVINDLNSDQNLKAYESEAKNKMTLIKQINQNILSFNSISSFTNAPQYLVLLPINLSLISGGKIINEAKQTFKIQNIQTDNYFGFTRRIKSLVWMPKIGILFNTQRINSQIDTSLNSLLDKSFQNQYRLQHTEGYINASTQYNTPYLKSSFTLPLKYHSYKYYDEKYLNKQKFERLTFEPSISLLYKKSKFFNFLYESRVNKYFGNITELYTGYIIKNSKSIIRSNGELPYGTLFTNSALLEYRNPISTLFYNIRHTNTYITRNILSNSMFDSRGIIASENFIKANHQVINSTAMSIGKLIKPIKTLVKIGSNINFTDQIISLYNKESNLKNKFYSTQFYLSNSANKNYSFQYSGSLNFVSGSLDNIKLSNTIIQEQNFILNLFITESKILILSSNYYSNNYDSRNKHFLVNVNYRYSISQKRCDLEISCQNLLNEKYFSNYKNELFYVSSNTFTLRPRQILFIVRFNLTN